MTHLHFDSLKGFKLTKMEKRGDRQDGQLGVYIPAEIRRRIKAKRFKLRLVEDGILLEPIDDIDIYYGKFGPANVEEIERASEDAAQVTLTSTSLFSTAHPQFGEGSRELLKRCQVRLASLRLET